MPDLQAGLHLTVRGPDHPQTVRRQLELLKSAAITPSAGAALTVHYEQPVLHLQLRGPGASTFATTVQRAASDAGLVVDIHPAVLETATNRWVITVFSGEPALLSTVVELAEAHDLRLERLTPLNLADPAVSEIRLAEGRDGDSDGLRAAVDGLRRDRRVDIVVQPDEPVRRSKRLVVFDMDSTLIQQEVIDELARAAGTYEQVAAITASAMNGELSFEASLRARVKALRGVSASVFDEVRARLTLTPGAERLIRATKRLGGRLAVISGGFIQVVEPFAAHLGLDYAFANRLEVRDGQLTGHMVGPIVDRIRKATLVESLAQVEGLSVEHVLALGDGANDLDMLSCAGLGVAFNAKPRVQAEAKHALNQPSLDRVLFLLGLTGQEIELLAAAR